MHMPRQFWTTEQDEVIRRMWTDSSASDIARAFRIDGLGDKTRSAIIGRAHRLGLKKPITMIWRNGRHKIESIVADLWRSGATSPEIVKTVYDRTGVHMASGQPYKIAKSLGLPDRPKSKTASSRLSARPTSTGRQTKGQAAAKAVNGVGGASTDAIGPDAAQVENSPTMAPAAKLVPLLEIKAGECRWPVEDSPILFCGAPAKTGDVSPYCAFHHRMAYVPRAKRAAAFKAMDAAGAAGQFRSSW